MSKYDYGFVVKYLPDEDFYKNNRQVFLWENGKLKRIYLEKNNTLHEEEFMYLHFFCRPMTYKIRDFSIDLKYVMYADVAEELKEPITIKYINKKGKNSIFKYYFKSAYYNRKKLTPKRILENVKRMMDYKRK